MRAKNYKIITFICLFLILCVGVLSSGLFGTVKAQSESFTPIQNPIRLAQTINTTPTPAPVVIPPNGFTWETSHALLEAQGFYMLIKQRIFDLKNIENLSIHSDPGNSNYTTLEGTWNENGVEMRLNIYFKSNETHWSVDHIRTYDGSLSGGWLYYYPDITMPLEQEFNQQSPISFYSTNSNYIHFDKLRLLPRFQGDLCQTDINFDGRTDLWDLNRVVARYHPSRTCTPISNTFNYCSEDVNFDGYVNLADISQFWRNFNSYCETSTQPTINSLSPTWANFGQEVLIDGRYFGSETGEIIFADKDSNSTGAVINSWSNEHVTFKIPFVRGSQMYSLTLKTIEGKYSNYFYIWIEQGQPVIDDITPLNAAPRDEIVLTGSDFGPYPGDIVFKDTSGTNTISGGSVIYSWSNTKIRANIPGILAPNREYEIQLITRDQRQSSSKFYWVSQ